MLLLLGKVLQAECALLIILRCSKLAQVCHGVDVLKALTTQGRTAVAGGATISLKVLHAIYLLLGHGLLIAGQVTVKGRVRCAEGQLKESNGICDGLGGNAGITVCLLEKVLITFIFLQLGGNLQPILRLAVTHFYGVQGRATGLFLKVCGAAIPELLDVTGGIEHRGRIHATELGLAVCTGNTLRLSQIIRAGLGQSMAARARYLVGGRKARVQEKHVTQQQTGLCGLVLLSSELSLQVGQAHGLDNGGELILAIVIAQ